MAKAALSAQFQIGSAGTETTLVTTLSDKMTKCDFSRSQDLPEANVFNQGGAKSVVVGMSGATFSCEFMWDSTISAHLNGLVGNTTAVNFQYGPDGSTTGYRKFTGTLVLSTLNEPNTVGEVKKCVAEFMVTGTITATTY